KVNTQSDENSDTCPSTDGQWTLARKLVDELKAIGMEEVTIDENAYVMATLPANTEKQVPVIGFLAHVDTATDFTGEGVNPQIVEQYDGKEINLNDNVVLSPKDFPQLDNYKGHTLITTDGTTLLGADNKAGIAEIMTAMEYLAQNPDIKHGKLRVAFSPDEEIGRGPHKFDVEAFGADYAYTMDGGPLGELQYESFNAAAAKVTFNGTNIHPGSAKDKMVNSILIAHEFQAAMPEDEIPQKTDDYEGFIHLMYVDGTVEKTTLSYIIRDHSREKFEAKKQLIEETATKLNNQYGEGTVELELNDQYYNMAEKIEPVMHIVDIASDAFKNLGIEPNII